MRARVRRIKAHVARCAFPYYPPGSWFALVPVDMATVLRGPAAAGGPSDVELRTGIIGRIDCGFRIVGSIELQD